MEVEAVEEPGNWLVDLVPAVDNHDRSFVARTRGRSLDIAAVDCSHCARESDHLLLGGLFEERRVGKGLVVAHIADHCQAVGLHELRFDLSSASQADPVAVADRLVGDVWRVVDVGDIAVEARDHFLHRSRLYTHHCNSLAGIATVHSHRLYTLEVR